MTTTDRRLIRRVMTVVAAMMIVVGVIAMHSFMAGHGPTARPEQTLGAALHHEMPDAKMGMHESMVTAPDPSPNLAPVLWVTALTGTIVAADHVTAAMCLAVLPPMALLIVLALLRRKSRQRIVPSEREVPKRWVAIRGSPPRPNTPSLSQLRVLRV